MDNLNKINELTDKLNKAADDYYLYDNPSMSDGDFDDLMRELLELEQEYPNLAKRDSPTNRVGGKRLNSFAPVTHLSQLLSLSNLFSVDEVVEFIAKVNGILPSPSDFVVEWKIDGLTVSLEYEYGKFIRGATRGDGVVGEDITENLRMIQGLPKSIKSDIPHLVVRGEAYLGKEEFVKLNQDREDNGLATFANPRNAAAGSLRQLDPNVTKERKLSIWCYEITYGDAPLPMTQEESLALLESLGFPVNNDYLHSTGDISKVREFVGAAVSRRHELPYEVDGLVIKMDNLNYKEIVGYTKKAPKFAAALKFPPEECETVLTDITLGLGRTGIVTPLGILNPVTVAGSTISKVALHNFPYIAEKDIRIGDHVIIHKAGDVIPEIKCSLPDKRDGCQMVFTPPITCPVCNSKLVRLPGEVGYYCTNLSCPDRIKEQIIHFVSRDAMNIDGLGKSIIESLLSANLIHNVADIYGLSFDQLITLPKIKEKSANNLLSAIAASKSRGLARLLFGLGIPQVGLVTATIIADYFKNMSEIRSYIGDNVNDLALSDIPNIGPIIASSITGFFMNEDNITLIERLSDYGLKMDWDDKSVSDKLRGLSLCFTGTLPTMSRNDAADLARDNGAKVVSSVSKNLDYLVYGDEAGSKLTKAVSLNIKILTEDEFLKLIK